MSNPMVSFERFRTVAFDYDIMRQSISRHGSALELIVWVSMVPEVYREDVLQLVKKIGPEFLGLPLTDKTLEKFTHRLHQIIFDKLEPVR